MNTNETKLVRVRDVLKLTGISRTSLWRLIKSGDFPAPFKLGPRMNCWYDQEVRDWINSRRENQAA